MVAAFAKGTVEFSFREQFIPRTLRWQWDEQAKPAAERATFGDRYRVHWFDAFPKGDLTAARPRRQRAPRAAGDAGNNRLRRSPDRRVPEDESEGDDLSLRAVALHEVGHA